LGDDITFKLVMSFSYLIDVTAGALREAVSCLPGDCFVGKSALLATTL